MASLSDGQAEDHDVWSVCSQLQHLSTGERATLRRMVLTRSPDADGIVEKLIRRAGVFIDSSDTESFQMWCLLTHAAAVIAGTGARMPHAGKRPLGRALSMLGIKSTSISRLLTARGPALPDQIRRMAYLLARSGDAVPVDMVELRDLANPNAGIADKTRRSIARAYYAAEDKKLREAS